MWILLKGTYFTIRTIKIYLAIKLIFEKIRRLKEMEESYVGEIILHAFNFDKGISTLPYRKIIPA